MKLTAFTIFKCTAQWQLGHVHHHAIITTTHL